MDFQIRTEPYHLPFQLVPEQRRVLYLIADSKELLELRLPHDIEVLIDHHTSQPYLKQLLSETENSVTY